MTGEPTEPEAPATESKGWKPPPGHRLKHQRPVARTGSAGSFETFFEGEPEPYDLTALRDAISTALDGQPLGSEVIINAADAEQMMERVFDELIHCSAMGKPLIWPCHEVVKELGKEWGVELRPVKMRAMSSPLLGDDGKEAKDDSSQWLLRAWTYDPERVFGLVPCGAMKHKHPQKARHLYTSKLFKANSAFIEHHVGDESWWIASAQGHAFAPDTVVKPYNISKQKRRFGGKIDHDVEEPDPDWFRHVADEFVEATDLRSGDCIIHVLGLKYAPIVKELQDRIDNLQAIRPLMDSMGYQEARIRKYMRLTGKGI